MAYLERFNTLLNRGLAFVAGCTLVAMMLLTVSEMVLRMVARPLAGIVEMIGWLAAVTTAFALGFTQIHSGHVSINLFVARLGPRSRAVVESLIYATSMLLFGTLAWQVFRYAGTLRASGSLSETMKVIVYPWVYLVSLGCGGLALALLVDLLKSVHQIFPGPRGEG